MATDCGSMASGSKLSMEQLYKTAAFSSWLCGWCLVNLSLTMKEAQTQELHAYT